MGTHETSDTSAFFPNLMSRWRPLRGTTLSSAVDLEDRIAEFEVVEELRPAVRSRFRGDYTPQILSNDSWMQQNPPLAARALRVVQEQQKYRVTPR